MGTRVSLSSTPTTSSSSMPSFLRRDCFTQLPLFLPRTFGAGVVREMITLPALRREGRGLDLCPLEVEEEAEEAADWVPSPSLSRKLMDPFSCWSGNVKSTEARLPSAILSRCYVCLCTVFEGLPYEFLLPSRGYPNSPLSK